MPQLMDSELFCSDPISKDCKRLCNCVRERGTTLSPSRNPSFNNFMTSGGN